MQRITKHFPVILLLCTTGCEAISSRVARSTTPGVVASGLESAAAPESKEHLRAIVSDLPVKTSVTGIEGPVVDSILERLAHQDNRKHLWKIAGAVEEGLFAKGSSAARARRDAFVAEIVRVTVRTATEELKRTLPSLIAEVASNPVVKETLRPLSRSAASGAVQGATDTLTGRDPPDSEESP